MASSEGLVKRAAATETVGAPSYWSGWSARKHARGTQLAQMSRGLDRAGCLIEGWTVNAPDSDHGLRRIAKIRNAFNDRW